MSEKKYVLDAVQVNYKLHRMALEIAEVLSGDDAPLVLAGIRNSGMVIAETIGGFVKNYLKNEVHILSISLDKHTPSEVRLSENIDLNGKNIIVADDVCNSGKTMMYALKPLLDYFPKRIQTLVLVERMHKFFPVKPDYVGYSLATTASDFIRVETFENTVTGAYIEQR